MIRTTHTVIRATIPDDARALSKLYDYRNPRAALLDQRRELLLPTESELHEMLLKQEASKAGFYTVEEIGGKIAGFCALRGHSREARYAEAALLFLDPDLKEAPLATEALAFLIDRAFVRDHLHKVVTHCLESEVALRGFLIGQGFEAAGRQRDAYYSRGAYQYIESLAHFGGPLEPSHGL